MPKIPYRTGGTYLKCPGKRKSLNQLAGGFVEYECMAEEFYIVFRDDMIYAVCEDCGQETLIGKSTLDK